MKTWFTAVIIGLISVVSCFSDPTPEDALKMLKDGNFRYAADNSTHPNIGIDRMKTLSESGQKPYAVIVTCADSRVAPELLFDCGLGDVFVIRVAGNVIGDYETASIDYAVSKLHAPLVVIMGHTHCGAVHAVVEGMHVTGKLQELAAQIAPAVETAKKAHTGLNGEELMPFAVKQNTFKSMQDLINSSSAVREAIKAKHLQLIGGIYDIANGNIDWLGELPNETKVIETATMAAKEEIPENGSNLPWWIFVGIAILCGIIGIVFGRMIFKENKPQVN